MVLNRIVRSVEACCEHLDIQHATRDLLLGHFVRDIESLSLEAAVKKITSDTAAIWGIAERGQLQPGYVADIAIFDPVMNHFNIVSCTVFADISCTGNSTFDWLARTTAFYGFSSLWIYFSRYGHPYIFDLVPCVMITPCH